MTFRAGTLPTTVDDLFERVFWRKAEVANEARMLWTHIESRDAGYPASEWKEWVAERGLSVGQYYNILNGLLGAGLIEKRRGRYYTSTRFLRELEQMSRLYASMKQVTLRLE